MGKFRTGRAVNNSTGFDDTWILRLVVTTRPEISEFSGSWKLGRRFGRTRLRIYGGFAKDQERTVCGHLNCGHRAPVFRLAIMTSPDWMRLETLTKGWHTAFDEFHKKEKKNHKFRWQILPWPENTVASDASLFQKEE